MRSESLAHVPRDDWQRIRCGDWGDAALIAARLEGGAPPDARVGWRGAAPLHLAAREGTAEAVAVLLSRRADVDARDDDGHTPLWYAACGVDEGSVGALIDAGADVWTPQAGPWSPGRLLLTTPLAPLVAGLPGAGTLPAEEAAAFAAADELIAAFGARSLWTEGLGIAFVRGLSEDEVIRRLGVDPARCPAAAPERTPFAPEEYDPEEYGDWPEAYEDHEEFLHQVGVTGVPGDPGGCVITQDGYLPNDDAVLRAISAGTTAYGIYFNPKGGTFGTLARDGECVEHEEIGLRPRSQEPAAYWHFRFWQSRHAFPHGANILAYGCEAAGLRIDEGRRVADRGAPRRRVRLPARFRR